MSKKREMSESGMLVYPKLPVPKGRESEPRMPKRSGGSRGQLVVFLMVIAFAGGAAAGFFVRPMVLEDSRVVDAENAAAKATLEVAEARQQITKLQEDSKKLDEQRDLLNQQLEAAKQAQEMVAGKAADASKLAAQLATVKKKLDATGAGTVAIVGNEVRLAILNGNLFKTGDDLSGSGAKVLDKVAGALKELANQEVAVHGHTDDQPPPKPKAPKATGKKDKKPPPPLEPAFATNWELSSARALAVVHYFQDKHKLDAKRLSAHAFSQYRPASAKNRAANRRIEIVLSPKPAKK